MILSAMVVKVDEEGSHHLSRPNRIIEDLVYVDDRFDFDFEGHFNRERGPTQTCRPCRAQPVQTGEVPLSSSDHLQVRNCTTFEAHPCLKSKFTSKSLFF